VAVPSVDGVVALQVWLDRCSVEIFADGGRVALTYLVFPPLNRRGAPDVPAE